jgi:hypothetical protein
VTYFVDNDLLGALEGSGEGERGVASLTAAVRSRLAPDTFSRRFHRIDNECTKWKVDGADGCPPSLPLLAVAVLAGTHMAHDTGIGANNYWKRFDALLGLARGDRKGISDVLPGLWDQFTWWLDKRNNGELGRSTVREDSWWTIIGYALSQALFRESDRQHLTGFFHRIGLVSGEEVSARELLQYFKAWTPKSRLSPGAKHMAADSRYDDQLASLLADEASRWDGVLRDEKGRRVGSLVVMLEPFPRPTYRVGAERPVGFPEGARFASNGRFSIELTTSVEGWFAEAWPLQVEWLADGLRLESDEFVLAFRGAPVLVLGKNRDLGCWASRPRLEPSDDHYVLADESQADAVEGFLEEHALVGWTRVRTDGFAPPGWVLFTDVVIEVAAGRDVEGPLAVLAPSIRERPSLRGGLPVEPSLDLYLRGGEPDLWLPSLITEDTPVTVSGRRMSARPAERISLRALNLPFGSHEIRVGTESRLQFSTVDHLREEEAPGTGSVVELLRRTEEGYEAVSGRPARRTAEPASFEVAVAGARLYGDPRDLPLSQVTIVLPTAAKEYTVLGAQPGQIAQPKQPDKAEWMTLVGGKGLFPIGFEVYVDFDVVWVLVHWQRGTDVRLRATIAVGEVDTHASPSDVDAWRRSFDVEGPEGKDEEMLWLDYRAAAAKPPGMSRTLTP